MKKAMQTTLMVFTIAGLPLAPALAEDAVEEITMEVVEEDSAEAAMQEIELPAQVRERVRVRAGDGTTTESTELQEQTRERVRLMQEDNEALREQREQMNEYRREAQESMQEQREATQEQREAIQDMGQGGAAR